MKVISKEFLGYDRDGQEEHQNAVMAFKHSSNNNTMMITQQIKISDKDILKTTITLLDLKANDPLFSHIDYVDNFFSDPAQFELYYNDL